MDKLQVNIVKPLKHLNLQRLRKKRSFNQTSYFPAVVSASLIATYLDLYFVGKGLYEFPIRPFPEIFSINIVFTLIILPLMILLLLMIIKRLNGWQRLGAMVFLSIIAASLEKISENLGFFRHSHSWSHVFSIIGYFLFLNAIWIIFNKSKR